MKQPSAGCRVVSGRTDTAETVPPTRAFVSVDLPAFGIPTTPSRSMRCSSRGGHRPLPSAGRFRGFLALRSWRSDAAAGAAALLSSAVSTRKEGILLVTSAKQGRSYRARSQMRALGRVQCSGKVTSRHTLSGVSSYHVSAAA